MNMELLQQSMWRARIVPRHVHKPEPAPAIKAAPPAPVTIRVIERSDNGPVCVRPISYFKRAPSVTDILRAVSKFYGVDVTDIKSARRHVGVIRPRHVAMRIARDMTYLSLPEIGRRMGRRDHSTVHHAVEKIARLMATDEALSTEIGYLKTQIQSALDANNTIALQQFSEVSA